MPKLSAVSALKASWRASMTASGLISSRCSFSASTFTCPTVAAVAISWRLMFEGHTQSWSTIVIWLTPERTSPSTHQLPTPPTPNTMTRGSARRAAHSSPTSRRVRDEKSIITSCFSLNVRQRITPRRCPCQAALRRRPVRRRRQPASRPACAGSLPVCPSARRPSPPAA